MFFFVLTFEVLYFGYFRIFLFQHQVVQIEKKIQNFASDTKVRLLVIGVGEQTIYLLPLLFNWYLNKCYSKVPLLSQLQVLSLMMHDAHAQLLKPEAQNQSSQHLKNLQICQDMKYNCLS